MLTKMYEHPSGVLLHVQYIPRTAASKPVVMDVRVAQCATYEPAGPNLMHLLHNTFTLDTTTDPALATRLLEDLMQDLEAEYGA